MNFNFLKYRKIYLVFSAILIFGSLVSIFVFGLKPGIDFVGGSILEIEYKNERPSNQEIKEKLSDLGLGEIFVQPTQENRIILRMKEIDEQTHQLILEKLNKEEIQEQRFESIGPVIGRELEEKTKIVTVLSLLAIVFYIALAFRKTPRPIRSFEYGIVSLILLSHDVIMPLGIFSLLGKFYGFQITIPVVIGLLIIIGYAINNTVVVFDRIRENLLIRRGISFKETANLAINQTLTRQINTSLTTLFPLIFIFFIGGETLKYFSLILILGISFGTYSSIFLAAPILVSWLTWRRRI